MTRKKKILKQKDTSRARCIELAKKIARMKANYKCAYCGRGEPQYQTHGSHIYGVGAHSDMAGDVDNILCLCATHHVGGYWRNSNAICWHEDPMTMTDFFRDKYPVRYKKLKLRTQQTIPQDWQKKYKLLKKQLNDLIENNLKRSG